MIVGNDGDVGDGVEKGVGQEGQGDGRGVERIVVEVAFEERLGGVLRVERSDRF